MKFTLAYRGLIWIIRFDFPIVQRCEQYTSNAQQIMSGHTWCHQLGAFQGWREWDKSQLQVSTRKLKHAIMTQILSYTMTSKYPWKTSYFNLYNVKSNLWVQGIMVHGNSQHIKWRS